MQFLMEPFVPLPRDFYTPSAREVAPRLLGHWLIRRTEQGVSGGPIVETEAYIAGDAACHAFPGLTPRNRVMFGPPGHAYVYFIYGCHYCVNVVCRPAGLAEAVLIRAIEPALGLELMRQHRRVDREVALTNGPGKLCQALEIRRVLDGADLCDVAGPLFIAENPHLAQFRRSHRPVVKSRRIGLTKAAGLELRFHLGGHASVSRRGLA
jgi:DNA-3-methyladenine glycosylase